MYLYSGISWMDLHGLQYDLVAVVVDHQGAVGGLTEHERRQGQTPSSSDLTVPCTHMHNDSFT